MIINFKNLFLLALHYSFPYKASRKDWWLSHVIALGISFVLGIFPFIIWETIEFFALVGIFPGEVIEQVSFIVEVILITLIFIPISYTYTVVSIKRLHDLGRSGWLFMLNFLIITIPFFILYLGFTKSEASGEIE